MALDGDVTNFVRSLSDARLMGHFAGSFVNNAQEKMMEQILCDNNILPVERIGTSTNLELHGETMPSGTYMYQPCGCTNTPDFLVKIGDTLFPIEMKSSLRNRPDFGSSVPRSDFIYIFSSKSFGTSVVLGSSIISVQQYQKCSELESLIKNTVLEWVNSEENRFTYCRPRLNWKPRYNFFEDTERDFTDVVNFVYMKTSEIHA